MHIITAMQLVDNCFTLKYLLIIENLLLFSNVQNIIEREIYINFED